jgi:glycosyltransferase involved in cell wall biosynthesis
MKIHYLSCHSILEYDEVQLLTDLGHEVFSNGAYLDPAGHITLPRPAIKNAARYDDYIPFAMNFPKTKLPDELIEPFDVIIVMHSPDVIIHNWERIKHKKVIWRTIGQSTSGVESSLKPMREQGLKIIRYSPNERRISNYIGEDALIRFYKDEDELSGWHGNGGGVVSFAQSLKGRRSHCHYDEVIAVMEKFNGIVYGPGNDDLGQYNGGAVPYETQIKKMQEARVMPYGGTAPASYTLSFIEALMMGLPIVAINNQMANIIYDFDFYEVEEILRSIGGIVCGTIDEMISQTEELLNNESYAKEVSDRQRAYAIDVFGKKKIIKQWEEFLSNI